MTLSKSDVKLDSVQPLDYSNMKNMLLPAAARCSSIIRDQSYIFPYLFSFSLGMSVSAS